MKIKSTLCRRIKKLIGHERDKLNSEPTEEKTANITDIIKRLEDETYSAYGVKSKPPGLKWVSMTLILAWKITNEPGLLEAITESDLEQLTEENFPTARHAAEVALHLKEYAI